jgi:hypothetical protein
MIRTPVSFVVPRDRERSARHIEIVGGCTMAENKGYGRSWKKWLMIYVAVGAIAYLIIYLAFFAHSGGGGGLGY